MSTRTWRRYSRQSGLTTVEYALMLFFFAVTAIFGFPTLAKAVGRYVTAGGDAIQQASHTGSP